MKKNLLYFLISYFFLLSCYSTSKNTNLSESEKYSSNKIEFPNNISDFISVNMENSINEDKFSGNYLYTRDAKTNILAGNNILEETNTLISSKILEPAEKYPNSFIYFSQKFFEKISPNHNDSPKSPLSFVVTHYGNNFLYPELNNFVIFKIRLETHYDIYPSDLFPKDIFPKEKLKEFQSKKIYLQLTFEKGKAFNILILEGPLISNNNQIDLWIRLNKKDKVFSLFSNFIKSAYNLLNPDPSSQQKKQKPQPALMRFAWEGNYKTESEKDKIVYSKIYKFEDKELVKSHYSLLRIFNLLNNFE